MTKNERPPRAAVIDETVAIGIGDDRSVSFLNEEWGSTDGAKGANRTVDSSGEKGFCFVEQCCGSASVDHGWMVFFASARQGEHQLLQLFGALVEASDEKSRTWSPKVSRKVMTKESAASEWSNSLEHARQLDQSDSLAAFQEAFHFPVIEGREVLYFTGNSLGLQPKAAKEAIETELEDWAQWGVEGHFHARNPWYSYHERFSKDAAAIVGALPSEVVMMNALTVNLHLLMVSFFRPDKGRGRTKILCEAKAFPSDQYALESQLRFHGLDPHDHLIEVGPREGEHLIRHEDLLQAIETHSDQIALVMIGGVNYYSGQLFDMEDLVRAGHAAGATVGFDLAHAAGNVPLKLHDWNVDFACWCTYKYLNSGPGSVSGAFVHDRHARRSDLPRFAGWWGYDKTRRFQMEPGFEPIPGAEGWQMSNAPVFNMAIHRASLDLFAKAGMEALRAKSVKLTGFMEFILHDISRRSGGELFEVITPSRADARGCQLSVLAHGHGRPLFEALTKEGVIADWREPNVIRLAPVPMYNSFEDVYRFGQAMERALQEVNPNTVKP